VKNFDYGHLLGRAWRIVWDNRILWLYGLMVALGGEIWSGASNGLNLSRQLSETAPEDWTEFLPTDWAHFLSRISSSDWTALRIYLGLAVGGCLVVALVLAAFAQLGLGGLVKSVQAAESGGKVTASKAWEYGRRFFWRVTGIALIEWMTMLVAVGLYVIGILVIIFSPCVGDVFSRYPDPAILFLLCPLLCCFTSGVLVINFYMYFSKLAAILEDKPWLESFSRAAGLLKSTIGPALLLGLLVYVVGWGVNFLTLLAAAPAIGFLLAGFAPLMSQSGTVRPVWAYLGTALFIVQIPVSWWIISVWVGWKNALYALFYQRAAETAWGGDSDRKAASGIPSTAGGVT
jgi:hypothetical protein